jgi:hypothetical protein
MTDLLQSIDRPIAKCAQDNETERFSQDPTLQLIGSSTIWEPADTLTSRLQYGPQADSTGTLARNGRNGQGWQGLIRSPATAPLYKKRNVIDALSVWVRAAVRSAMN